MIWPLSVVLHLLRGCSEIYRRTLTSDAALAWIMIPWPVGTTAALNPSVLCIPRLFIPAGSNPLETDLDTGYPIHFWILFVWESTGRIQAFTRSIVERVQKKSSCESSYVSLLFVCKWTGCIRHRQEPWLCFWHGGTADKDKDATEDTTQEEATTAIVYLQWFVSVTHTKCIYIYIYNYQ